MSACEGMSVCVILRLRRWRDLGFPVRLHPPANFQLCLDEGADAGDFESDFADCFELRVEQRNNEAFVVTDVEER